MAMMAIMELGVLDEERMASVLDIINFQSQRGQGWGHKKTAKHLESKGQKVSAVLAREQWLEIAGKLSNTSENF